MYKIRRAKENDLEEIVDLVNKVFRAPDLPLSMGQQFPLLLGEDNVDNLYIAENEEGKIVSHNGIIKNRIKIYGHQLSFASMGSVCTHPDYRGQGIATSILEKIFENLYQEKVSLLTISGARGLYTRQGADFTAGKKEYLIDKNLDFKNNNKLDFHYYKNQVPDKMNEITEIYHNEPVRYERKRWEFPLLINAMAPVHDVPYPPDYFVLTISRKGRMLAYIVGQLKEDKYKLIEYAGERLAVIEGIKYLKDEKKISEVNIDVPFYDKILSNHLDNLGVEVEESSYGATYKVINQDNLITEIIPIIKEKNRRKQLNIDKEVSLKSMDKEKLLHFLFDDYSREEYENDLPEVLPLPLPNPGCLNYI
ncbi:MAG: GNAT family N-acetyltransferase [Bacillota bacterium]